MENIAKSLGITFEIFRFGILLLSGFPLSIGYKYQGSSEWKHFYSICTSSLLIECFFSVKDLFFIVGLCSTVYFIVFMIQVTGSLQLFVSPFVGANCLVSLVCSDFESW